MKTSHFQTSHFQLILVTIIFISSCVVTSLPSRQKLLPAKIVKTNNGNTQLQRAGKNPFLFQHFVFSFTTIFPVSRTLLKGSFVFYSSLSLILSQNKIRYLIYWCSFPKSFFYYLKCTRSSILTCNLNCFPFQHPRI